MANDIQVKAMGQTEDKKKLVEAALADIEKELGKGTILKLNTRPEVYPHVPSGLYTLDYDVLGIGGMPKGRISEIFGPEASGKTTIALMEVAEAQRKGGLCAYVDVEHALDPHWMKLNGVNVDELLVSQPDAGEDALKVVQKLVETGAFAVIVVDSVAALTPRSELEGEIGDSHMGLQARLMSQACRILRGQVNKSDTVLIFINQIREKIGVTYGSPETTTGGRALKFYASVRLDVRRISALKKANEEEPYGARIKIKCVKNKMASPFKVTEVDMIFGQGFDKEGNLIDKGVEAGVVEKSGSWFSYKGERLGQGKQNAADFLRENGHLIEAIRADIVAAEKETNV